MEKYNLTYKPYGATAILIEWPGRISESIIQDIISFEHLIAWEKEVADTIIAYNSLTVLFKGPYHFQTTVERLQALYKEKKEAKQKRSRCWKIPVCYDVQFGLDLEELATTKGLSVREVIELHTAPQYLIYFLGFQPGFLYLGGLNRQLFMPRKSNPRVRVAKGAVGIGGEQTGVYPQNSAGGWNLIGNSPINFFDITKAEPCFAKAGDRIRFHAVDLAIYNQIEKEVQQGSYKLKFQEA